MREAFYPALFEELGIPYTGSDAYTNAITLDKWLTKLMVQRAGVESPRGVLVTLAQLRADHRARRRPRVPGDRQAEPRGLEQGHLQRRARQLGDQGAEGSRRRALKSALRAYPDGVLVEEYIDGIDVAVGFIEGVGHDDGLLTPVEMVYEPRPRRASVPHLRLPAEERRPGQGPVPLPGEPAARCRGAPAPDLATRSFARSACATSRAWTSASRRKAASTCSRSTRCRRSPRRSSLFAATAQVGLTYQSTIAAILNAAALRSGLATASQLGVARAAQGPADPRRLHVQRQARAGRRRRSRVGSAGDDHRDRERARAPGPHRRPPRGHAGLAAGARGSRRRPDLQHRRRRRRP